MVTSNSLNDCPLSPKKFRHLKTGLTTMKSSSTKFEMLYLILLSMCLVGLLLLLHFLVFKTEEFKLQCISAVCLGNRSSSVWCPNGRFPKEDGTCQLCYAYCGKSGCTGPSSIVGEGGCKTCWKGIEINSTHVKCILPYFPGCSTGYYLDDVPTHPSLPLAGSKVCRTCDPLCETCMGPGVAYCIRCKFYKLHYICVDACPPSTRTDEEKRICVDTNDNPQKTMIQYIYNRRTTEMRTRNNKTDI